MSLPSHILQTGKLTSFSTVCDQDKKPRVEYKNKASLGTPLLFCFCPIYAQKEIVIHYHYCPLTSLIVEGQPLLKEIKIQQARSAKEAIASPFPLWENEN